MTLWTACPAKINVGLRVVRHRPDGYHDLLTTFVQLAHADRLGFEPAGGRLRCETTGRAIDGPADRNLVLRAAAAYGEATGLPTGGTWRLDKRIPVAAGLGGGSSDAAGVLRILQRYHSRPLGREELRRVAVSLGADVPFFLVGGAAVGQGRGDEVRRVSWPGAFCVVLVIQETGLSTRQVFQDFDATGTQEELTPKGSGATVITTEQLVGVRDGAARVVPNALAEPAFRRMPGLRDVMAAMQDAGFAVIGLSGSGPTVYGLVRDRGVAWTAARGLRGRGWDVVVTAFRRSLPRVLWRAG